MICFLQCYFLHCHVCAAAVAVVMSLHAMSVKGLMNVAYLLVLPVWLICHCVLYVAPYQPRCELCVTLVRYLALNRGSHCWHMQAVAMTLLEYSAQSYYSRGDETSTTPSPGWCFHAGGRL